MLADCGRNKQVTHVPTKHRLFFFLKWKHGCFFHHCVPVIQYRKSPCQIFRCVYSLPLYQVSNNWSMCYHENI